MTMEADLTTALKTVCVRVYPDVAPSNAQLPYITYQHIGGTALRYVANNPASIRHSRMQINAWSTTRAEALTLIRSIEEVLCASTAFTARPESEPIGDMDEDSDRRACIQDFEIWSPR